MWADQAVAKLSENKIYQRDDLRRILESGGRNISDSSFRWVLYNLEKNQRLFRVGYNSYVIAGQKVLPAYRPVYSEGSVSLIKSLEKEYPSLSFVLFENVLLNEFLNHQIAQNTLYLQVEKEVSGYIFDSIKEAYPGRVLYKPNKNEFELYWTRDCIVVLDLISQSPICSETPHAIVAEKLLVDIIADKSIAATFSPSELPSVYKNFLQSYRVDQHKLKRYAGRRGKMEIVEKYIREL